MNTPRLSLPLVVTVVAVMGALAGACNHVAGPSLSYSIDSQALVATSDTENASALCCCRVKGMIRNTSTIAAHLSLRFKATNNVGGDAGTAQDFLESVPAGESRAFDAPGILEACSKVSGVTTDVVVIGLFDPTSN